LILRKIIKTVATRCHIVRLKCTKFDFGWGYAQTPLGSSQRSPRRYLDFSYLGLFVPWTIRTIDGLFVPWTVRTVDCSCPPGLFVPWTFRTLDCSYHGLFVLWTIRTVLDCSYHGLFVPSLDDSYLAENGNIVYTA